LVAWLNSQQVGNELGETVGCMELLNWWSCWWLWCWWIV